MKRILMTTAIAALAASPVLAESDMNDDTSATMSESASMTESNDSNDVVADMEGMQVRASDLIGKSVYILGENASDAEIANEASEPSEDWERVGEVGDVIISGDGEIESVTLDAGGFLGIGEKQVSAALDELKFVSQSSEGAETDSMDEYFVVFTGDRTALEDRDELDQTAVRDGGSSFFGADTAQNTAGDDMDSSMSNDTADAEANDLTEEQMANNEAAETDSNDMANADNSDMTDTQDNADTAQADATDAEENDLTSQQMSDSSEGDAADTEMGSETAALDTDERGQLTAEDLEGVSVYGNNDERLGEISNLVLSDDGQIAEVIVDVGGFLGIGEKPVALPFDDIELRHSEEGAMSGGLRATAPHTSEELEGMDSWEG